MSRAPAAAAAAILAATAHAAVWTVGPYVYPVRSQTIYVDTLLAK